MWSSVRRHGPWAAGAAAGVQARGGMRKLTQPPGQTAQELARGSRTVGGGATGRRARPRTADGQAAPSFGREPSDAGPGRRSPKRKRSAEPPRGKEPNWTWRTAAGGQLFEVQPGRKAGTPSAAVKSGAGLAAPACRLAQSSRRSMPSRSKPWRTRRMIPSGSTAKIEGTCVRP